jgi:N-carbamoylputrescine amidase
MPKTFRVAFVEWPEGLMPGSAQWLSIAAELTATAPDILLTNEMPFGPWLAGTASFDARRAAEAVGIHERGIDALADLQLPLVLSSRPVPAGHKLANEAFALSGGEYRYLHQKHYFPEEPGWHESSWFQRDKPGFSTATFGELSVGALLCTELMFNEHARALGRAGAQLIYAPRASGTSVSKWRLAAGMGAFTSGAYVFSPNRVGRTVHGQQFGGRGLAFAPDGTSIDETSSDRPLVLVDIDVRVADRQKAEYPCYIRDI